MYCLGFPTSFPASVWRPWLKGEEKTWFSAALNPGTPPDVLWRIAVRRDQQCRDPVIVAAVALNPNAPADLLKWLFTKYPGEVLANPALPLLLIEQPDFLDDFSTRSLKRHLSQMCVSPALLAFLGHHTDPHVAQAARQHVGSAGEAGRGWWAELRAVLAELFDVAFHEVLELVELGLAPPILMEAVAGSGSPGALRAALAGASRLADVGGPAGLMHRAAGSDRAGRWGRPDLTLPPSTLTRLSGGDTWSRLLAARHPNTPPDELSRLAHDPQPAIRLRVARNPSTPPACRALLAHDDDPRVGRAARRLRNPSPDPEVASGTPHPQPPTRTLPEATTRGRHTVCAPRTEDPTPYAGLDVERRCALAADRSISPEVLSRLACDPHWEVRCRLATHRRLPMEAAARLFRDSDPRVVEILLIAHPSKIACLYATVPDPLGQVLDPQRHTSPDARELLFGVLGAMARCGVFRAARDAAAHPLSPPALLLELAVHQNSKVRHTVARRPGLPFEVYSQLRETALFYAAQSNDPLLRFVEILHLPRDDRRPEPSLASEEWLERLAAVLNPATPPAGLPHAAQDSNRFVRAAARARIRAG